MDFEEVWQDIIDNLNVGEEVYTLTQRVRNRITDVGRDSITVMSERTKKERKLLKRDFKPFVDYLLNRGSLDFMHDLPESDWIGRGAIIIAILTKLDYVDYETRPRRLFLRNR